MLRSSSWCENLTIACVSAALRSIFSPRLTRECGSCLCTCWTVSAEEVETLFDALGGDDRVLLPHPSHQIL